MDLTPAVDLQRLCRRIAAELENGPPEHLGLAERVLTGDGEAAAALGVSIGLAGSELQTLVDFAHEALFDRRTQAERSPLFQALRVSPPLTHQGAAAGATVAHAKLRIPEVVEPHLPARSLPDVVAEMNRAWAPGVEVASLRFLRLAQLLDAHKAAELDALREMQPHLRVRAGLDLLSQANVIHGKPGHSAQAARVGANFFGDPEVQAALRKIPGWNVTTGIEVERALPWLNLGDLEVPVSVLAAHRKLSNDEFAQHVLPRAARAADLFEGLELGTASTAEVIRKHRARGERPLTSTLVDLLDQVTAMAAKPYFGGGDREVDVAKLSRALRDNAARSGVDPEVVNAIVLGIERGLADPEEPLRPVDLYVV